MLGNLKSLDVETLCRKWIFLNDIDDSKMFKRICMMTQEVGIKKKSKKKNNKGKSIQNPTVRRSDWRLNMSLIELSLKRETLCSIITDLGIEMFPQRWWLETSSP